MIEGYAAVFWQRDDSGTQFNLGQDYVERIMPGAFDRAVRGASDVVALFNHNADHLLGRVSAGTLQLSVDQRGLKYRIDEASTQLGRDVEAMQRRGDLAGSSFGFVPLREIHTRDGSLKVREVHDLGLRDVGPVTFPAYPSTADRQRGLVVRCVAPDGACLALDGNQAAEARSLWSDPYGLTAAVRARAIRVGFDSSHAGGV